MSEFGGWDLDLWRVLTTPQLDKFFCACSSLPLRDRVFLLLVYNLDLRACEAVHVRVSAIDPATNSVMVIPAKKAGKRRKKQKDGSITIVERPLPAPMLCPIDPRVMPIIQEYISESGLKGDYWLFPGAGAPCEVVKFDCPGGHWSKRSAQRLYNRIALLSGVKRPGVGIHALRHGRLTEVAAKTRDPYLVKHAGRLSSIAMADRYVHLADLPDRLRKVDGRI